MGLERRRIDVADLTEAERAEVFKRYMDRGSFVSFSRRRVNGKLYFIFSYEASDQLEKNNFSLCLNTLTLTFCVRNWICCLSRS